MNATDIARNRAILYSARLRFSPETQPVRETAIDKIMEQNLLIGDCVKGLSLQEIEEQGTVSFAGGIPAISRLDIQKSIERLVEIGRLRVSEDGKSGQRRFRLSEPAIQELWEVQRATETRFERVVGRLFKNADEGISVYSTPFLECLCIIFARLGETYVRLIKGDVGVDELVRSPSVYSALREVKAKYQAIDGALFEAAVFSFFRDSDPDYDAIKWNMAQNHYIAKALGLDPSGYLLSDEVFGSAVFYLDTNVVIHALEPKAQHHRSFEALSRACKQLRIDLYVCQISLDELRSVVEYQREILEKVAKQIPDSTAPKVRGIFFQLYREQQALSGTVGFNDLFAGFVRPREMLAQSYNVELIDDIWFAEAEGQRETAELVQAIKNEYQNKRGRQKHMRPALHDALLLRWVQLERERSKRNVWLVTLDTSLPGFLPQATAELVRPFAITLDALLQWISPIAIHDGIEDEVAAVFSEAIKYRLLPQEGFFELRDFLVFAEMEWSCKELPAEDVEECIRYLRNKASELDPSDPADREKIAHEISRFFADPGRKYKQEVQRLEAEMARVSEDNKHRLDALERAIDERDERIAKLEKERVGHEERKRKEALKKSARVRMAVVVLLFLVYQAVGVYLAWQYGSGPNFFQRVINAWPLLSIGGVIGAGLFWFVLGKERIRVLGWPFTRLLKDG